jgi:pimeloyl-ACP methyl ester carboxylesterase
MPTAALNGIDVYFETRGSGPRLLLFNGSGGSIAGAAPLIDKLAEHFEVLVHDQRCLGRTTVTDDVPSMADYAADAAALLQHVGWETTNVLGISFGGMVAQEFAVTWAQRVERLVLLCTSPGGEGGSSYPLHTIAAVPPDEQDRLRLHLADTRYDDAFLAANPFDRMLVDLAASARAVAKSDEQRRGEELQLLARAGHDVWDRLPAIACPTFIGCGEFDALAPPANSDAIASRVADSVVRRYVGGHAFVWQDRRAMPDVIGFLRGGEVVDR